MLLWINRYRTMLMEKMDILRSWHNKISPHISRHLSTKSFVEDSISPLLHILSPPTLRPVIHLHCSFVVLLCWTCPLFAFHLSQTKCPSLVTKMQMRHLLDGPPSNLLHRWEWFKGHTATLVSLPIGHFFRGIHEKQKGPPITRLGEWVERTIELANV